MLVLSQEELRSFYTHGRTAIWQYNTLYKVDSVGEKYCLVLVYRRQSKGVGVTLRGRFMAMEPREAWRYIH